VAGPRSLTGGGEYADQPGGDDATRGGDQIAATEVTSGCPKAGAALNRDADLDRAVALGGVFDAHHGVRSLGQHRPGHDPQRRVRLDGGRGRSAGTHFAQQAEVHGLRRRCRPDVDRPNGVAVHGGVREGWDIAFRTDLLSQHATAGLRQGNVFCGERGDPLEDSLTRLRDRQHGRRGPIYRSSGCFRTRACRPRRR